MMYSKCISLNKVFEGSFKMGIICWLFICYVVNLFLNFGHIL